MIPDAGGYKNLRSSISWAKTDLKNAGVIENPLKGIWRISEEYRNVDSIFRKEITHTLYLSEKENAEAQNRDEDEENTVFPVAVYKGRNFVFAVEQDPGKASEYLKCAEEGIRGALGTEIGFLDFSVTIKGKDLIKFLEGRKAADPEILSKILKEYEIYTLKGEI